MHDKEELELVNGWAKQTYPAVPEVDFALETYAEEKQILGIFFPGDDGERKMWGPDCEYYHRKDYAGYYYQECSAPGAKNRTFFLHPHKPPLKQIDRPKPAVDRRAMAHCSENGWRLARSNKRHILKFPREILNLIIKFAVCVERPAALRPLTINCTWKRQWSQAHYQLVHGNVHDYHPGYGRTKYKLRNSSRTAVDASCLRTCKLFSDVGHTLLYGSNDLHFNMTCTDWESSPPSMLHPKDTKQWRPNPYPPRFDAFWQHRVDSAIGQVRYQVNLKVVPGWVAYDAFLRFLWTIGPEKAALLKSLKFQGCVKIHQCGEAYCGNCRLTGIVESLRLYIPFILKLSPGVETLLLYVNEDHKWQKQPQILPAGQPRMHDEALVQLLENEIRQIPSLKELNVVDWQMKHTD